MKKITHAPKREINSTLIFFLVILVLLAGLLFKKITGETGLNKFKTKTIPEAVKKVMGNAETKFKVESIKELSGIYEFVLSIESATTPQKYTSYITKDGKILFTSGIKLADLNKTTDTTTQTKKLTCNDLNKAEKAKLTAFVVADCPYGLQIQRVYKTALNELPQLQDYLEVKYIGSVADGKITSMHGDKEAEENLRQICIREEQKTKYWDYVTCYMKKGESENCLSSTGINSADLTACTEDSSRGLKYAKGDFDLANKFKVGGSPTLLLNNSQIVSEFDFGGRVANAIKEVVCCGSKTKADFCSKEISKDNLASSYSEDDVAGAATSNTAAGCE